MKQCLNCGEKVSDNNYYYGRRLCKICFNKLKKNKYKKKKQHLKDVCYGGV